MLRHWTIGLLFCFAISSCKQEPQANPLAMASVSASVSAVAPSGSVVSAPAKAKAKELGKTGALTPAEQREAKVYLAALGRGRKATTEKRYPDAIVAFDAALKLRPKDARAISERGFAKLLAEDRVGARADLTAARELAHDALLLSQILHNLGRLERDEGHVEQAAALFARAKTFAAAARGGAKASCPVETVSKHESGKVLGSWQEVLQEMTVAFEKEAGEKLQKVPAVDSSDDAIIAFLSPDKPATKGAWLLQVANEYEMTILWGLVIRRADGKLAYFGDVAIKRMGRCSVGDQAVTLLAEGSALSVTVEAHFSDYAFMCEGPKGDSKPCHQVNDDSYQPVQSYCEAGEYSFATAFYDVSTGARVLELTERASEAKRAVTEPAVQYEVQKDGIQLVGAGCSEHATFATAP